MRTNPSECYSISIIPYPNPNALSRLFRRASVSSAEIGRRGRPERLASQSVAEYLRAVVNGKGQLSQTGNGTPYSRSSLHDRWLTPRLEPMRIDEKGMCLHDFCRFRKTRLKGEALPGIQQSVLGGTPRNDARTLLTQGVRVGPSSRASPEDWRRSRRPNHPSCSKRSKISRRIGTRSSGTNAINSVE
jgi:hypothetical protein